MINKPNAYDNAQPYVSQEKLPPGGYVLKIMSAKVANYSWGDVLVISFDISEGEYTGFYQKNYRNQVGDKKWKGNIRITIPTDNDQDDRTLRRFKTYIAAIEKTNEPYVWDWDEDSLKGKTVGGLFRNKEWEQNGNRGFYTECCQFCSAERIRAGNFTTPADKMLQDGANQASDVQGFSALSNDDDIPF